MKRYLIFAALVPLLGGFLLLLTTTVMSGYWSRPPSLSEAGKLVTVFARTLQYSYLFGLLPALMLGAVDDIILHVKRIGPVLRLLIVGLIGFCGGRIALRVARVGQRHPAIRSLRPRRLRSRSGVLGRHPLFRRPAGHRVSRRGKALAPISCVTI